MPIFQYQKSPTTGKIETVAEYNPQTKAFEPSTPGVITRPSGEQVQLVVTPVSQSQPAAARPPALFTKQSYDPSTGRTTTTTTYKVDAAAYGQPFIDVTTVSKVPSFSPAGFGGAQTGTMYPGQPSFIPTPTSPQTFRGPVISYGPNYYVIANPSERAAAQAAGANAVPSVEKVPGGSWYYEVSSASQMKQLASVDLGLKQPGRLTEVAIQQRPFGQPVGASPQLGYMEYYGGYASQPATMERAGEVGVHMAAGAATGVVSYLPATLSFGKDVLVTAGETLSIAARGDLAGAAQYPIYRVGQATREMGAAFMADPAFSAGMVVGMYGAGKAINYGGSKLVPKEFKTTYSLGGEHIRRFVPTISELPKDGPLGGPVREKVVPRAPPTIEVTSGGIEYKFDVTTPSKVEIPPMQKFIEQKMTITTGPKGTEIHRTMAIENVPNLPFSQYPYSKQPMFNKAASEFRADTAMTSIRTAGVEGWTIRGLNVGAELKSPNLGGGERFVSSITGSNRIATFNTESILTGEPMNFVIKGRPTLGKSAMMEIPIPDVSEKILIRQGRWFGDPDTYMTKKVPISIIDDPYARLITPTAPLMFEGRPQIFEIDVPVKWTVGAPTSPEFLVPVENIPLPKAVLDLGDVTTIKRAPSRSLYAEMIEVKDFETGKFKNIYSESIFRNRETFTNEAAVLKGKELMGREAMLEQIKNNPKIASFRTGGTGENYHPFQIKQKVNKQWVRMTPDEIEAFRPGDSKTWPKDAIGFDVEQAGLNLGIKRVVGSVDRMGIRPSTPKEVVLSIKGTAFESKGVYTAKGGIYMSEGAEIMEMTRRIPVKWPEDKGPIRIAASGNVRVIPYDWKAEKFELTKPANNNVPMGNNIPAAPYIGAEMNEYVRALNAKGIQVQAVPTSSELIRYPTNYGPTGMELPGVLRQPQQPEFKTPVQNVYRPASGIRMTPTLKPITSPSTQPSIQTDIQPGIQSGIQPSIYTGLQPALQIQPATQLQPALQISPRLQPALQMKVRAMPAIRPGITTTPYPFMGMPLPEGPRMEYPGFKGRRKNMYTPSIYSIEVGITAVRTPKTKMFSGAEFRPLITRTKIRRAEG